MMTRNNWIQHATRQLHTTNPSLEQPIREARLLLCYALKESYEAVYFHPDLSLSAQEQETADLFLKRRLAHEPLSKITEQKEFYGRLFKTTRDTLDPRPDTETLIRAVSMVCPVTDTPLSILDLGTGTGCLIITLLSLYPRARGIAVDISPQALDVAVYNSHTHEVSERLILRQSNWFSALDPNATSFDLVISNPPYIAKTESLEPDVALYDPQLALFAAENGLAAYQEIAAQAKTYLAKNGIIMVEVGYTQHRCVQQIFESHGFTLIHPIPDYGGHIRVLVFGQQSHAA